MTRFPTRAGVAALAALPLAAQSWTLETPPVSSPPRVAYAMAYDQARDRTVMFGGNNGTTFFFGDAWEYDGTTWTAIAVPAALSARTQAAMAYDHARHKVVLYGGLYLNSHLNDTWEYDGTWTHVVTAHDPGGLQGPVMTWDAARRRVVLFGGSTPSSAPRLTWEFDGVDWQQVTTVHSPSGGIGAAMVYDASRGRCVLVGGPLSAPVETWEYDGVDWLQVVPMLVPPGRWFHGLVYDVVRGRVVLFGGNVLFLPLGDMWEYDGTTQTWSQVTPQAPAPSARSTMTLVYDTAHRCCRMFGGVAGVLTQNTYFQETWTLVAAAAPTWTRHGTGCAGSAGVPSLDPPTNALPILGTQWALRLTSLPASPGLFLIGFGFDIVNYRGAPLPIDLGSRGLAGCLQWVAANVDYLLPHAGSAANFPLAFPAVPALAGTLVATQAMVVDPSAQNGVGAVSNGGILLLR